MEEKYFNIMVCRPYESGFSQGIIKCTEEDKEKLEYELNNLVDNSSEDSEDTYYLSEDKLLDKVEPSIVYHFNICKQYNLIEIYSTVGLNKVETTEKGDGKYYKGTNKEEIYARVKENLGSSFADYEIEDYCVEND